MIKLDDDAAFPIIREKLHDKCMLPEFMTFEDDLMAYSMTEHYNYFTDDLGGLICISIHNGYIGVPYTYSDMRYSIHKELITFAKKLYKRYTIIEERPILYTGLKNFYPNHSVELAKDFWQFKPKD